MMGREEFELTACRGKQAFTAAAAKKLAASMNRRGSGYRIRAYRCRCCRAWHVGNKPK